MGESQAMPGSCMRETEDGLLAFVLLIPIEGEWANQIGVVQAAMTQDGMDLDQKYRGKWIRLEKHELPIAAIADPGTN